MILKAVANPPKILWGPFLPVLLNIGVQFPLMFMAIGVFNMNPILFLASVAITHIFIVSLGIKEPHLSTMIPAFGQTNKATTNLYKAKGKKFAP